jgi:hypothetical protein
VHIGSTKARLQLVDLAGSERAKSAKTSGERMKEGIAINLSLSALRLVLSQMAEGIPQPSFRDSNLTAVVNYFLSASTILSPNLFHSHYFDRYHCAFVR